MLSREAEERLAEILVQRVEKVNANILEEIGKSLKQISTLNISQSRQLQQMLKYGADYNKLVRILSKLSGKSVEEIHKIFKTVARTNKEFARDFYDYRNVAFIPYDQDIALKRQVLAMANLTADLYRNITSTSGIGLIVDGEFKQLQVAYTEIIDRAITSVVQGKEDFYKTMRNTLKEVGGNGLVVYDSGRTRRLDSAVRMNILDGIRMVNNETNRLFGEEYGADGVEITVHEYPAPDHADVQGRQFSNVEYERLQAEGTALTVEGDTIDISIGVHHRPISELNCYHRPMNIVIGISKPQYSKEELQQIKEKNEKGFDFEGKHYTMYEGTQLQRQIETAIRKNKDTQILARASGDKELADKSQIKINLLTNKYKALNKASGLSSKDERLSVSGYRKIKVEMPEVKVKQTRELMPNLKGKDFNEDFFVLTEELQQKNIILDNSLYLLPDKQLRNLQAVQLYRLSNKYEPMNKLYVRAGRIGGNKSRTVGNNNSRENVITLNTKYYNDAQNLLETEKRGMRVKWHPEIKEPLVGTITHEYGHMVENDYVRKQYAKSLGSPDLTVNFVPEDLRRTYDAELRDELLTRAINKLDTKMTRTAFKRKYWSDYAQSKMHYEWFAEGFLEQELGTGQNVWTETIKEWLEEFYGKR